MVHTAFVESIIVPSMSKSYYYVSMAIYHLTEGERLTKPSNECTSGGALKASFSVE